MPVPMRPVTLHTVHLRCPLSPCPLCPQDSCPDYMPRAALPPTLHVSLQSLYFVLKQPLSLSVQDSCPDYMLKAEDCLRLEEERVENYLHGSTKVRVCVCLCASGYACALGWGAVDGV